VVSTKTHLKTRLQEGHTGSIYHNPPNFTHHLKIQKMEKCFEGFQPLLPSAPLTSQQDLSRVSPMCIDRYSASDDATTDHFVRPSAVLMQPPTAQQIASVESNHIRRGILRSEMDGHEIIREERESVANSAPSADRISTIIKSRVEYSAYYDDSSSCGI
jgi:hypothetical protein